jgi:structural maintenance of chromosome 1
MALSEESLENYRKLYIVTSLFVTCVDNFNDRKASASILAVDERQSIETLTRDEKTSSRALAQLGDKQEQLEQKKEKLSDEAVVQGTRKATVGCLSFTARLMLIKHVPTSS